MKTENPITDPKTGLIYFPITIKPKKGFVFIFLLLFCFSCKSIPTPKEDIIEIEQTLIFEDKM